MGIEERIDATIKNVEGKAQEAVGEFTGNPEDRAEGKAKQVEAEADQTKENLKDKVKSAID